MPSTAQGIYLQHNKHNSSVKAKIHQKNRQAFGRRPILTIMFIIERLTDVIAPFCCLGCGREGSIVCNECLDTFCLLPKPHCYRCQQSSQNFATCQSCTRKTPLGHVWMASQLKGLPEKLVHTFKFERAQATAPQIAKLMTSALPTFNRAPLMIPIPSATSRVRQRGYDHTVLLARALSRQCGHDYKKVLNRHGQSRQVGATRVQRLAQLQGAFRVNRPLAVKGEYILLVDDVVTTGATLEEAAKALRRAGAKRIDALVFAQKQ